MGLGGETKVQGRLEVSQNRSSRSTRRIPRLGTSWWFLLHFKATSIVVLHSTQRSDGNDGDGRIFAVLFVVVGNLNDRMRAD